MVRSIQRDKNRQIRNYDGYNDKFYGQQRRVLSSLGLVADAPLFHANKYLKVKQEKIVEDNRPYPNRDFVGNCYRVMWDLLKDFIKVYPELISQELQECQGLLEKEKNSSMPNEKILEHLINIVNVLMVEEQALKIKQQSVQNQIPER